MPGVVVTATHTDSVLVAGPDGLAVTLPASALLAADAVLTRCRRQRCGLYLLPGPNGGWVAESTQSGSPHAAGATPWAAVVALAAELERGG